MAQFYIYKHLPSEHQDMLDGARIVSVDNPNFKLSHEKDIADGPYSDLKELKSNSPIYKELLMYDKKRAEKIVLEKFIVEAEPPIIFEKGLSPEYEKIIYRVMQHSLNGTIKGKDVKGIHMYNEEKVRILKVISSHNEFGVFKAEIEVLNERTNNWIKKDSETTFFPINWNTQRLVDECYTAFVNKEKISEIEFHGITKSGIRVAFVYSKDGEFKTVYPIYDSILNKTSMENRIEIEFKLGDVTNKFLLHLKYTTDYITHIYYAVNNSDINIHQPLPTDSFPIIVVDQRQQPTLGEQKQLTFAWALTKAFEEFINGLTKSFKETYKYLRVYTLSKEPKFTRTRENIEAELKKIEIEMEKMHFPDFMDKIEKMLEKSLPLKEEILSINQVRNCLVHRHGVVGEKDVKNSATNDLSLKWTSLKFMTLINGQLTEITYEMRKNGMVANGLNIQYIKNEKTLRLNEKVSFNLNEFNGIAFTCANFANNLFSLMPRPIEGN